MSADPSGGQRGGGPDVAPVAPAMRLLLSVAAVLVFLAGVQLFVFPLRTETYFAWTIGSPMTATFLGASYWSAIGLELGGARARRWADARVAVPAVFVFTTLTLVVTLVHLDNFHLDAENDLGTRAVTWAWLAVYAAVPVLMILATVAQRRLSTAVPPASGLPSLVRAVLAVPAVLLLGPRGAPLVAPGWADAARPGSLTPPTRRGGGGDASSAGRKLIVPPAAARARRPGRRSRRGTAPAARRGHATSIRRRTLRAMDLPISPPVKPMLAKAIYEVPRREGLLFEPKWDGFRCLVFRDGDEVELWSRTDRPLTRYFPEMVAPLVDALPERCVVDGELVVVTGDGLDFDRLQLRLHPAESRITKLAGEIPASYVAFDLLALDDRDLTDRPFSERRRRLEAALAGGNDRVHLTPVTDDADVAEDWFRRFEGAGFDGVMAKPADGRYRQDKRDMFKVKHQRTADCVVAGFRWHKDGEGIGSLLLGLYDLNSEFDVIETAGLFLNSSFGIGAEYGSSGRNGPSIFPATSFGARLSGQPVQSLFIRGAVLDGVPGDPPPPEGVDASQAPRGARHRKPSAAPARSFPRRRNRQPYSAGASRSTRRTTRKATADCRTSSGMPRSRPTYAVAAAIVIMSMYSRTSGPTPLRTISGTAAVTASSDVNGARTVVWCGARG